MLWNWQIKMQSNLVLRQNDVIKHCLLLLFSLVLCSLAQDKLIGVCRPYNGAKTDDELVNRLWAMMESEVSHALHDAYGIRLLERVRFQEAFNEAELDENRNLLVNVSSVRQKLTRMNGVNFLLASSIGTTEGWRHRLNIVMVDTATGGNISGTDMHVEFGRIDESRQIIADAVMRSINGIKAPPLVALLPVVVSSPYCPANFQNIAYECLKESILENKVRVAMLSEVKKKLFENGVDFSRTLPSSSYSKVEEVLGVRHIIQMQLLGCDLTIENSSVVSKGVVKAVRGNISGCITLLGDNGSLLAVRPFVRQYDFMSLSERNRIEIDEASNRRIYERLMAKLFEEEMDGILQLIW